MGSESKRVQSWLGGFRIFIDLNDFDISVTEV